MRYQLEQWLAQGFT
ncbi:TPA: hypothetical protein ACGOWA_002188, partial [Streptococcus suis]